MSAAKERKSTTRHPYTFFYVANALDIPRTDSARGKFYRKLKKDPNVDFVILKSKRQMFSEETLQYLKEEKEKKEKKLANPPKTSVKTTPESNSSRRIEVFLGPSYVDRQRGASVSKRLPLD